MTRITSAALVAYGAIAIATYGFAFVGIEAKAIANCEARAYKSCNEMELAGYGGFLSAIAWPMYWSVQAARSLKETRHAQ